jgi:hypothetical protein
MASVPLELPFAADLATFWKSIPIDFLLVGHSLFCAGLAPEFKQRWLVHYIVRRHGNRLCLNGLLRRAMPESWRAAGGAVVCA